MKKKPRKKPKQKTRLAAKRTRPPGKSRPKKAPNPRAIYQAPESAVAMTTFLTELRKKIIDATTRTSLWPTATMALPADALADLQAALAILFNSAHQPSATPAVSGQAGTLENHVTGLMNQLDWPATSDIPADWSAPANRRRQFRFYEVAWAVNFMLEAYANFGGGGGGPRDWPPPGPDRS